MRVKILVLASCLLGAHLADAQCPQLVCCPSSGSGLAQGPGDFIADEEILRGDSSGIQGSPATLTDAGVLTLPGQLNVDNLRLDGNVLSTTATNGDIVLEPNGSGVLAAGMTSSPVRLDLYSSRTDSSNYLKLSLDAGSNFGAVSLEPAGSGNGANVLYISNKNTVGGANIQLQTAGVTRQTITQSGLLVQASQAVTCPDSGNGSPGTLTLQPTLPVVLITNSDPQGCTVTMSETTSFSGAAVMVIVVSNAGGTVDFADTSGVSELAGAYSAGLWDALKLLYVTDRWVEISRSNN